MRSPLMVSLGASSGVFLAALLAGLFHNGVINGHTLTPLELLPSALVAATFFAGLALLGVWLALRRAQRATYLAGMAVSVVYVATTILANTLIHTSPQKVSIPSQQAAVQGLELLLVGTLWGLGAPYLIARLVGRVKLGTSNGA